MLSAKKKSKMICIRLSDEEFRLVCETYEQHGARSLSDFARTALQCLITRRAGDLTPSLSTDTRFAEINERIDRLAGRIEELYRELPGPEVARRASA